MSDFWRIVVSLGVPGLALGVFYMLYGALRKQWSLSKLPTKWVFPAICLYMALAAWVVLYALKLWAPVRSAPVSLYHVRIIALGPEGLPAAGVRVWSSVCGEAKAVDGGWEIEVAAAKRPANGELEVRALQYSTGAMGITSISLANEAYVSQTIRLKADLSTRVRGIVSDPSGQAIQGVRVSVEGFGTEAVLTTIDGEFDLPAHAPAGQPIFLRAEKKGRLLRQMHPAGGELAYLVFEGGA